jgi:hypothetical protein
MTRVSQSRQFASASIKELSRMLTNRILLLSVAAVATSVLALSPASASADPSPWWQVLTGSRPTNLWIPQSQVQEIDAPSTPFILAVGGSPAGFFNGPFPPATAENVQTALEGAYGAGDVEVTGGPGGTAPLIVTSIGDDAGRYVAPIEISSPLAPATAKILVLGGSGRLILTLTNLGDLPVEASSDPVTIVDELPEGVVATGVEGFAGAQNVDGPVDCEVAEETKVLCTFEGSLPSYEAIEIEVIASLIGDPPTVGAPGKVTVSGGEAPPVSSGQEIRVSPLPTPFGIERFSGQAEEEGGAPTQQAGAHPFQLTTTIQLNSGPLIPGPERKENIVEQPAMPRNFRFVLPAGLVGNAAKMPQCGMADFLSSPGELTLNNCSSESAIGVASVTASENVSKSETGGTAPVLGFVRLPVPVFNLPPRQGEPARFGFTALGNPVIIDTAVDPDDQYRILASVDNATQLVALLSSTISLWGTPGDPRHDSSRGWNCTYPFKSKVGPCERPAGLSAAPFLRQPVSCATPLDFRAEVEPWNVASGALVAQASFTGSPQIGCNQVPFDPRVGVSLTNRRAESPSGLDFELHMPNAGLLDPESKAAEGQAKRIEVTMPEGVTLNPSQAEGLVACDPAAYARESAGSPPGQGCPEAAKVGSVRISTPLLEEEAEGSVYVATPYNNPFGSLLALYVVAKIPERGILVKQAGKVHLNPNTGQLVTTFDDLPQIPFDTFELNFFGGDRAPLAMPSRCGTYEIVTRFTPWHATDPDNPQPDEVIAKTSSFTVDQGPAGGSCPSGAAEFKPGFSAGTTNNAAGKYSPFVMRLTRKDGEQEFSRFSVKLPKGVIGKLAGIPFCPEAAIGAAKARIGPNGGQEELDSPSCPAGSQLGHTQVGAGVGPSLAYAPGKIYLAGPYRGAKLSVVAIATAKVGPFDLGNVVIRQALRIDPETAEVTSDGASSDPIPHILKGVVVHARDIQVHLDRSKFVLNPTSCERMAVSSTVVGAGLDFGTAADDQTATPSVPFQVANCDSLGFKPKLSLSLRGGTKRGDTPRLKAVLKARKGDANIGRAQVTLPHSAFLEQAHIRTVCTRVQFAAGGGDGEQCPKGSIYGRATAISPLLDERLKGRVYLRSSNNPLPDLVTALHSRKVDINLVGRIDSVDGGIRTTFAAVPDAPVAKFTLEMRGGQKGLIVNSTDICNRKHRADVAFEGQNGRLREFRPLVKARCGGGRGGGRR